MENENLILTVCNRDGAKLWFEQRGNDEYVLKASKEYVLENARTVITEISNRSRNFDMRFRDNKKHVKKYKIQAFDPAGGPYLIVGCKIGNKTLKRIVQANDGMRFIIQ